MTDRATTPTRLPGLDALADRIRRLRSHLPARPPRIPISKPERPAVVLVAATPTQQAVSVLLAMISAVIIALLVNLVLISPLIHYTNQVSLYSELRLHLAEGSVPLGPVTSRGALVVPGTPVATVAAPQVGMSHEVVVQGTASGQTMVGVGHRRDSVMPCQHGTSVLMARAGAYGGVGSQFASLAEGDYLTFTMGQGKCTYRIMDHRMVGDDAPAAPKADEGRLVLTTAAGAPYMPTEVLRIDAELVSKGYPPSSSALPAASLPTSEAAMGTDTSNLFGLVLLLELLVAVSVAITWLWRRWGKWQTWIVGVPAIAAVAVLTANSINQWLLPNLL